ncbi:MAG: DUF4373 domain-containing protein [Alistipes sp.]
MARTNKIGIDYFPFDVDFFQDDKIQLIEAEFGVKGGYIAIRLLCKIYREGYFYQWGADECLLFTKNMGVEGVSKSVVDEVVKGLVKRGFFNESVFNSFNILTSVGIQKRYFEITKRYKSIEIIKDYMLVDVLKLDNVNIITINVDINSKSACTNPQNKRKEKKKKEIKENKNDFDFSFCLPEFISVFKNWIEYKNARGEKYKSAKSLKALYDKLLKISGNSSDVAQQIIDESMANNWAGIFPLRDEKEKSSGKKEKVPTEPKNYDDEF